MTVKSLKEARELEQKLFQKYQQPVIMSVEYWYNSQLSVARLYGKCELNGIRYVVAEDTFDLVMEEFYDVYKEWIKAERPHYDKKTGKKIESKESKDATS